MLKVSETIAQACVSNEVISSNEKGIVAFGIKYLIFFIANMLIPISLGIAFGSLLSVIVCLSLFFSIRRYAGGHHAKTQLRCFIVSQFLNLSVILFFFFSDLWNKEILLGITICSFFLIFRYAPLEAPNNQLSDKQRQIYRKKSIIISLLTLITSLTVYVIPIIGYACIYALYMSSFLMLMELVKRMKFKEARRN